MAHKKEKVQKSKSREVEESMSPEVQKVESKEIKDILGKEEAVPEKVTVLTQEYEALKKAQKESEEYLNLAKRIQADYINYQKRMETWKIEQVNLARGRFLEKLIPVMDSFEFALKSLSGKPSTEESFQRGVELIHHNLTRILSNEGVQVIENGVGQPFDPHVEEVVDTVYRPELEEGIVVEFLRKGYLFEGKVLRPAQVRVATRQKINLDVPSDSEAVSSDSSSSPTPSSTPI